jgi:hypothetical protein
MLQDGAGSLNDAESVTTYSKAELVIDIVHEEGFIEVSAIRKNVPL